MRRAGAALVLFGALALGACGGGGGAGGRFDAEVQAVRDAVAAQDRAAAASALDELAAEVDDAIESGAVSDADELHLLVRRARELADQAMPPPPTTTTTTTIPADPDPKQDDRGKKKGRKDDD